MSLPTEWPGMLTAGILPCANCGDSGRVVYIRKNAHIRSKEDAALYFYVKCTNAFCRARSGMFLLACDDPITCDKGLEVQQLAINAWNQRVCYAEDESITLKDMAL